MTVAIGAWTSGSSERGMFCSELTPTAISRPNSTSVNCQRSTLNFQMRKGRPSAGVAGHADRATVGEPGRAVGDHLFAGREACNHDHALAVDGPDGHLPAARDARGGVVHVHR